MNRKIKLIWDFRGPNALKTAEHHVIHLKEYVEVEQTKTYEISTKVISDFYVSAFVIVDEKDMLTLRDALKPHRASVAN